MSNKPLNRIAFFASFFFLEFYSRFDLLQSLLVIYGSRLAKTNII